MTPSERTWNLLNTLVVSGTEDLDSRKLLLLDSVEENQEYVSMQAVPLYPPAKNPDYVPTPILMPAAHTFRVTRKHQAEKMLEIQYKNVEGYVPIDILLVP